MTTLVAPDKSAGRDECTCQEVREQDVEFHFWGMKWLHHVPLCWKAVPDEVLRKLGKIH